MLQRQGLRFARGFATLAALSSLHAAAARPFTPPQLLRDFNTTPTLQSSSNPNRFTPVGDRVVFIALGPPGLTADLWGSDGVTTERLLPAVDDSALDSFVPLLRPFNTPQGPRLLVTRLAASLQGGNSTELWITDGTAAGTTQLLTTPPAGFSADLRIREIIDVGGGLALIEAGIDGLGLELWRTDGTPAGSGFVASITPGPGGTTFGQFTRAGSLIFFAPSLANLIDHELWVTDGAIASTQTRRVRDIQPGDTPSHPIPLGAIGSTFLFSADGPGSGRELWRSNGTEAGTVLVKDINPGEPSGNAFLLANLDSRVVFTAGDATRGFEPWVTDGTSAGTLPLADINPGLPSASINPLIRAGVIAYFLGGSPATGTEIWRTDGTPTGTRLLAELSTAPNSDNTNVNRSLKLPDNRVVFLVVRRIGGIASQALYVTDPGGDTLTFLAEYSEFTEIGLVFQPLLNGRQLFLIREFGSPLTQLWSTDLTPGNARLDWTVPVPVQPGNAAFWTRVIAGDGTPGSDRAVFNIDTPSGSTILGTRRVFYTDGSEAGSGELFPFGAPGAPRLASSGDNLAIAGNRVFVAVGDERGVEPWVTIGRPDSTTHLIANIRPDATGNTDFSIPTRLGSRIVFTAAPESTSGTRPLFSTDGMSGGTIALGWNVSAADLPISLTGNRAAYSFGENIVITDGTAAGTAQLFPAGHPATPFHVAELAGPALGGRMLFIADDPLSRSDLWLSDGTFAGTQPIGDILPVGDVSSAGDLTVLDGDRVCFVFGPFSSQAILSTDGASIFVHSNMPGGATTRRPNQLTAFGSLLAFRDNLTPHGDEIRVLNPADNSIVILEVVPGAAGSFPSIIGVFGPWLAFTANDANGVPGTYISDGTVAGTFLADPDAGPNRAVPEPRRWWNGRIICDAFITDLGTETLTLDPVTRQFTLLGETAPGVANFAVPFTVQAEVSGGLFGYAANESTGIEPWFSDGTTAGTRPLADLFPGSDSSHPQVIGADAAGHVYLTALTAPGNAGIFMFDGTTLTRLGDSAALASEAPAFPSIGSTMVFAGVDATRGRELWSWRLPTPTCPADFNADQQASLDDIFDFLAAFLSADPRADFNTTGNVTVQDLFDFLVAYFRGCP